MTGQPTYPYSDGVRAVLGPDVTATADGSTIRWQGATYRRDRGETHRDLRVLADEVTRLSAVTGQLRALATRWQASVRPGESHPAAAAILHILDDTEPSVAEAAADDRRWDLERHGE